MLTEYEVRQKVDAIRVLRIPAFRKAKLLVRLGKALNLQEKALRRAHEQTVLSGDRRAQDGLGRMEHHTQQLHEEVLDAAFEALHPAQEAN